MPIAFDGTVVPASLPKMNCGGIPVWDYDSEAGYICNSCFVVIGSVGQSDYCKKINQQRNEDDDS